MAVMRRWFLCALVLVSLAAPAPAYAGDARLVMREVPLGNARTLAAAAPLRFDMLGLHWVGSGGVAFRTRSIAGHWSGWTDADTDGNRAGRWQLGNPFWTGTSDRVQYRLDGSVRRLRAYFVWSPVERKPQRTLSTAGSPPIIPRSGWQANERIRRAKPR
jgi:hypothetical protein